MIRVLFVIENLGGGGAERVLVNLVNAMDKSRFDVTVMTLFDKGVNAGSLDDSVRLIDVHKLKFKGMKTVTKLLPKRLLYNSYIGGSADNDYDIIIPYMTGVPTTIASGSGLPKIAWIHGEFFEDQRSKYFGLKPIYDRYDCAVGVSEHVRRSFTRAIGSKLKTLTLYNTNDTARIRRLAEEAVEVGKPEGKVVVSTVGCLESTKGYDRLINAAGKLRDEGRVFEIRIIGEGRDRPALEKRISDLGLGDTVKLLGYQTNPYKYVAASDLFVCSSRTEGLSTAVSEAVILGKPVVSTDVSGAREILGGDNEYGLIVESSEDGIYGGLKLFIDEPANRDHYAAQAKIRAPFFEPENTVGAVESLIERVVKKEL
ncbi:MAG: glycosyltransferase [Clostridia bacterium]|nr:glycosyltransferase [Clostridia bacterium]